MKSSNRCDGPLHVLMFSLFLEDVCAQLLIPSPFRGCGLRVLVETPGHQRERSAIRDNKCVGTYFGLRFDSVAP